MEMMAPIFADGYHYDIILEIEIDFGLADITSLVNFPKHNFTGYYSASPDLLSE